jgi:hypothetical protein
VGVTVGDTIVVDGVPDPELIQKQVFTEVAFAAEACNLLRAASDAGQGCRYFRGGDGSDVPSAGMILHQTDLAFLPV